MSARDAIVILGMGRSGTSALARVLALCGGALPLELLPPNDANPTGYWEPASAMVFNELFLRAHGSSWYDASPGTIPLDVPDAPAFLARIAHFLEHGFAAHGPIVLKEPRITALLPFWLHGAAAVDLRVVVAHVFRAPGDVAASLAARDGLAADRALELWLKYNLLADRGVRAAGLPRTAIAYESLVDEWEPIVRRLIERTGVPLAIDDAARAEVAGFLAPELRHHRGAGVAGPVDPQLRAWVDTVYDALRTGGEGGPPSDVIDAVYEAFAERVLQ